MKIEFKAVTTPQTGVVIGNWHLAFCTVATLSAVGHKMTLCNSHTDMDKNLWNEFPKCPVQEPGLEELIAKNISADRLNYCNSLESLGTTPDFAWIAIDTPVDDSDLPDPSPVAEAILNAAKTLKNLKCIFVSSQIPLGFCREMEEKTGVPIVYVPENLRLGKGLETFYCADRTPLGATKNQTLDYAKKVMGSFPTEFLESNLPTAEMIKHANNIFLATSISFANELATVGERLGVDSLKVAQALKKDKRIGPMAYVAPGLGFAGGTLPRDLRVIQSLGKSFGVKTRLVDSVLEVNLGVLETLANRIFDFLLKNPSLPKSALILGYTYKADTNTLRRSPSIDLAKLLKKKGVSVLGFDPIMNSEDLSSLNGIIRHVPVLEEIGAMPGVVVVMTGRPGFGDISWEKVPKNPSPSLFIDTQNLFTETSQVLKSGFWFQKFWGPTQKGNQG